ncbi:hypothetical protein BJX99DRAFT_231719 [Aspergillus californicus]
MPRARHLGILAANRNSHRSNPIPLQLPSTRPSLLLVLLVFFLDFRSASVLAHFNGFISSSLPLLFSSPLLSLRSYPSCPPSIPSLNPLQPSASSIAYFFSRCYTDCHRFNIYCGLSPLRLKSCSELLLVLAVHCLYHLASLPSHF